VESLIMDAAKRAADYLNGLDNRRVGPSPESLIGLSKFNQPLQDDPLVPESVLQELNTLGSPATVASAVAASVGRASIRGPAVGHRTAVASAVGSRPAVGGRSAIRSGPSVGGGASIGSGSAVPSAPAVGSLSAVSVRKIAMPSALRIFAR